MIDAVRSYAPGFIFTTALPPAICAAATAAIRHLKTSSWERERHQDRAARVKAVLDRRRPAGDAERRPTSCRCWSAIRRSARRRATCCSTSTASTSSRSTTRPCRAARERLRITPSPYHDDALIDALAEALVDVWERLGLPEAQHARGGRIIQPTSSILKSAV